jgi:16S rRNA C967 or C1407 C5-methylase (RsmB/RsmF family)/NOL1/NOP2/fmu family ribosome biogenesis protein
MKLPEKFATEMEGLFARHPEIAREGFYESFDLEGRRGVRFSCSKTAPDVRPSLLKDLSEQLSPVPWCSCGYYISPDMSNRNPYYHAGVYYPQEPSAMLPAEVIAVKPGETVLDMCAAPGGKACRMGEDLHGSGLLVANEISFERSKALLRNIERSGIPNVVILNENPDNIARELPGFFDKILIDAPCSGEGMFRRDPRACRSYEEYGPAQIAPVQKSILDAADICLKDGGEIVYSTCTFCEDEDEGQIATFMASHPGYEVICHPEIKGVTHNAEGSLLPGSMRIWPHISGGDGHFCVHLRKSGERRITKLSFVPSYKVPASARRGADLAREFLLSDILSEDGIRSLPDVPFTCHGSGLFLIEFDEKLFEHLKTVKTGLYIGDFKAVSNKTVFSPSNSLALWLSRRMIREDSYIALDYGDDRVIRYLKGETITAEDCRAKKNGSVVIGVKDYPLGFGKISGQTIKNLYPKAWRIM